MFDILLSLFAEMAISVPSLEHLTVPSDPMGGGGSFSVKKNSEFTVSSRFRNDTAP